MFIKKLEIFFLFTIIVFGGILCVNYYNAYEFKHNPLPQKYQIRIKKKEQEVLVNMQKHYGVEVNFPVIITGKISGKLYGLTTYENGKITIYLNKNVLRESIDYVVANVIPHEYAHALLFYLHENSSKNGGHTVLWKETCQNLGGKDCRRFVNQDEVVMDKMHNI